MTKDFGKFYYFSLMIAAVLATMSVRDPNAMWQVVLITVCLTIPAVLQFQVMREKWFAWKHSEMASMDCRGHKYFYGLPDSFLKWKCDRNDDNERIIGVALRHPSGLIYAAYSPLRHHHVIGAMDMRGHAGNSNTRDQGFMTNHGRYVGRREGMLIARKAMQLLPPASINYKLYSEDLWD